jgi:hypothetical protein
VYVADKYMYNNIRILARKKAPLGMRNIKAKGKQELKVNNWGYKNKFTETMNLDFEKITPL